MMNTKQKILGVIAAILVSIACLSFFWGGGEGPRSPQQFSVGQALGILQNPTDDRLALDAFGSLRREGEKVLPQVITAYRGATDPVARYWLLKVIAAMPPSKQTVATWVELIGSSKEERDQRLLWDLLKHVSGKKIGLEKEGWEKWWEAEGKQQFESVGK